MCGAARSLLYLHGSSWGALAHSTSSTVEARRALKLSHAASRVGLSHCVPRFILQSPGRPAVGFDEGDIPPEEERSAIKLCEKVVALADRHQAVVAGSVDATGAVAAARVMRTYIAVQELQIVKAKDWSNCGVLLGDALDSVESIRQMSAHLHKHSFPHKGEIDSKFTQSSSPHVWHAQSETCLLSSTT